MSFREGLKKLADEPPSEIVPTKFGDVKIMPPLAARADEFRKALGGEKGELPRTHAVIIALGCFDPATNEPIFGLADIPWLEIVPVASFAKIIEAIQRVSEGLSLDPTTPTTETLPA